MQRYTITPIRPKPASQVGALDGFACQCSCGLTMSSSLRGILQADRGKHIDWHIAGLSRKALVSHDGATDVVYISER